MYNDFLTLSGKHFLRMCEAKIKPTGVVFQSGERGPSSFWLYVAPFLVYNRELARWAEKTLTHHLGWKRDGQRLGGGMFSWGSWHVYLHWREIKGHLEETRGHLLLWGQTLETGRTGPRPELCSFPTPQKWVFSFPKAFLSPWTLQG